MVACENGVYKVTPPAEADGEWECEQLLDTPASDILYLDFDGDGERELLVLSPFHGDTLTIQKKLDGSFQEVYRHGKRLPFLHAIWGAEIGGKVYGFIGNREEDRDLFAIYWNGERYVYDTLDQGAGAANVLHFRARKDLLLAANRETDEIAVYTLTRRAGARFHEQRTNRKPRFEERVLDSSPFFIFRAPIFPLTSFLGRGLSITTPPRYPSEYGRGKPSLGNHLVVGEEATPRHLSSPHSEARRDAQGGRTVRFYLPETGSSEGYMIRAGFFRIDPTLITRSQASFTTPLPI